jgi:hypothetical protein
MVQQRYYASSTEQTDFRHIGTEKDAGALQDLLRRVMEIDAEITCTPVVDYKPNVKSIIIEASSGIGYSPLFNEKIDAKLYSLLFDRYV